MRRGTLDALFTIQRAPRGRWFARAIAATVGLALASVHWSGLLVGGVLVGWTFPTLGRAVLAGLLFGVLALATLALTLWVSGTLDTALEMGPIPLVTAAIPLLFGTIGGLSRGLVRNAPARTDEQLSLPGRRAGR